MIRNPNKSEGRRTRSLRESLLARLLELQPELRRRLRAEIPIAARRRSAGWRDQLANATLRQLEVLRLLADQGALAMHDLARLGSISRSSATEVVDRLEAHGLVERVHDPVDRRTVQVTLTRRSKLLVARMRRTQLATIAGVLAVCDDQELATLVTILEKVVWAGMPAIPGVSKARGSRSRSRIPQRLLAARGASR